MMRGLRRKFSSKDPVSKWLRNIKKFETEAAGARYITLNDFKEMYLGYLPKEKNNFGIKFKSQFYKDRAEIYKKKKKKKEEEKKWYSFIQKRKFIKLTNSPFVVNLSTVNLAFTVPEQNKYKIQFYKGRVTGTLFKQHRDDNNRLIFKRPRGNNKFIPDIVDNYIGELYITVRFEDNEIRHYTIEKLLLRIQVSKHQWLHTKNLENIRKNSKPMVQKCVLNQQS